MRNNEQLPPINLTPTTHVPLSQFREVNRPLILRRPFHSTDFSLARINLDKRTGANKWKKGEVLKADVAIHGLSQVEMLQQVANRASAVMHPPGAKPCFTVLSRFLDLIFHVRW